jgi:hypothetical protein
MFFKVVKEVVSEVAWLAKVEKGSEKVVKRGSERGSAKVNSSSNERK